MDTAGSLAPSGCRSNSPRTYRIELQQSPADTRIDRPPYTDLTQNLHGRSHKLGREQQTRFFFHASHFYCFKVLG